MDEMQRAEIILYRRAEMGRRLNVQPQYQRILDAAAGAALVAWGQLADRRAMRLRARRGPHPLPFGPMCADASGVIWERRGDNLYGMVGTTSDPILTWELEPCGPFTATD